MQMTQAGWLKLWIPQNKWLPFGHLWSCSTMHCHHMDHFGNMTPAEHRQGTNDPTDQLKTAYVSQQSELCWRGPINFWRQDIWFSLKNQMGQQKQPCNGCDQSTQKTWAAALDQSSLSLSKGDHNDCFDLWFPIAGNVAERTCKHAHGSGVVIPTLARWKQSLATTKMNSVRARVILMAHMMTTNSVE